MLISVNLPQALASASDNSSVLDFVQCELMFLFKPELTCVIFRWVSCNIFKGLLFFVSSASRICLE